MDSTGLKFSLKGQQDETAVHAPCHRRLCQRVPASGYVLCLYDTCALACRATQAYDPVHIPEHIDLRYDLVTATRVTALRQHMQSLLGC